MNSVEARLMLNEMEHEMNFPKAGTSTAQVIQNYHPKLRDALIASLDREAARLKAPPAPAPFVEEIPEAKSNSPFQRKKK